MPGRTDGAATGRGFLLFLRPPQRGRVQRRLTVFSSRHDSSFWTHFCTFHACAHNISHSRLLDQIRSDIHTQKHTMKPKESRAKIVPPYTISASLRGRKPHSCLHSSQTPLRGIPSPSGDRGQGRLPPRIGRGAKTTQARRADNSDLDRTREGALRLITLALRLVA